MVVETTAQCVSASRVTMVTSVCNAAHTNRVALTTNVRSEISISGHEGHTVAVFKSE